VPPTAITAPRTARFKKVPFFTVLPRSLKLLVDFIVKPFFVAIGKVRRRWMSMADDKKKRLEVFVAKLRRFRCVFVTFGRIFIFEHGVFLVLTACVESRHPEITLGVSARSVHYS
jgi:hypothetical protein